MTAAPDWLTIRRGNAPLLVSLPHTGTNVPEAILAKLESRWLALKDTDWFIERLYDFAETLDATIVRTDMSRTVIDVNRDPSGQSLYPGQTTTGLCPLETFDGEPLYKSGMAPDEAEITRRRETYFAPYHAALRAELDRLRGRFPCVALYDCHSIRSVVPRLFDGVLPNVNIGTNSGTSCDSAVTGIVQQGFAGERFSLVTNGRFKGGWITRHYGDPPSGIHAVQVELACRGYLPETPGPVTAADWPPEYDPSYALAMRERLTDILRLLRDWAAAH